MKLIKKLKEDKTFRFVFVIIVIVILHNVITVGIKLATAQSTCNNANVQSGLLCEFSPWVQDILGGDICMREAIAGSGVNEDDKTYCLNDLECKVGREKSSSINEYGCFSCVPNNIRTYNTGDCCSGYGTTIEDENGFEILCKSYGGSGNPNCETEFQSQLANIVDSVWTGNPFTCKVKYYAVAGVGGFMALSLILAVL